LTLNGTGSYDNIGIVDHIWRIESDAKEFVYRGEIANCTLNEPDNYSISLKVLDKAGNSDTKVLYINVRDITPPIANAGEDQEVSCGTRVTFSGSGSSDNEGIVNLSWTFEYGEGTISLYGWHPDFTFISPGTFKVTLKVMDAAFNIGLDDVTIIVKDMTSPIANAGPDQTVQNGTLVILNGLGSSDNIGIVNWTWSLTYNKTNIMLYGEKTYIRFLFAGNYSIELTVKDAAGNMGTDEAKISVTEKNKEPIKAPSKEDEDNYLWIILVIIFVTLALILGIFIVRRRKKISPSLVSENVWE
jgi:hypothetical protein